VLGAILIATVTIVGVLLIFYAMAGARQIDPVQARLSQLGSMQARTLEEIELQLPLFERTLRPLATRLSGLAQRFASPSKVSRTEKRLAMAGNPGALRTIDFLGLKLVVAVLLAGGAFLVLGLLLRNVPFGLIVAMPLAGMGFMMPEMWLSRRIKKRQKRILMAVPDTLDLLTISVKAGLGFDAALAKVTEKVKGPISDEFRRALAEIRVGNTRREALRNVVNRTDVPALTNFVGAIIQAEQLGVSISKVLIVQSEQLRIDRRQRAEEAAAKAPIKMLFPLVGCIFPSMFIVILAPALLMIMVNMSGV